MGFIIPSMKIEGHYLKRSDLYLPTIISPCIQDNKTPQYTV